jgi:hypothetical protein
MSLTLLEKVCYALELSLKFPIIEMEHLDVIKAESWTSGEANCANKIPQIAWCASDQNVTLASLQSHYVWWDKSLKGDFNNGLTITATSTFAGKATTSTLQYICEVFNFIYYQLLIKFVINIFCSLFATSKMAVQQFAQKMYYS